MDHSQRYLQERRYSQVQQPQSICLPTDPSSKPRLPSPNQPSFASNKENMTRFNFNPIPLSNPPNDIMNLNNNNTIPSLPNHTSLTRIIAAPTKSQQPNNNQFTHSYQSAPRGSTLTATQSNYNSTNSHIQGTSSILNMKFSNTYTKCEQAAGEKGSTMQSETFTFESLDISDPQNNNNMNPPLFLLQHEDTSNRGISSFNQYQVNCKKLSSDNNNQQQQLQSLFTKPTRSMSSNNPRNNSNEEVNDINNNLSRFHLPIESSEERMSAACELNQLKKRTPSSANEIKNQPAGENKYNSTGCNDLSSVVGHTPKIATPQIPTVSPAKKNNMFNLVLPLNSGITHNFIKKDRINNNNNNIIPSAATATTITGSTTPAKTEKKSINIPKIAINIPWIEQSEQEHNKSQQGKSIEQLTLESYLNGSTGMPKKQQQLIQQKQQKQQEIPHVSQIEESATIQVNSKYQQRHPITTTTNIQNNQQKRSQSIPQLAPVPVPVPAPAPEPVAVAATVSSMVNLSPQRCWTAMYNTVSNSNTMAAPQHTFQTPTLRQLEVMQSFGPQQGLALPLLHSTIGIAEGTNGQYEFDPISFREICESTGSVCNEMQENSHRKHDMPELKIVNKKMTPINIPNTTELSIHTTNDDNTNNNINHNTATVAAAAAPFDIKNHFDLKLKARIEQVNEKQENQFEQQQILSQQNKSNLNKQMISQIDCSKLVGSQSDEIYRILQQQIRDELEGANHYKSSFSSSDVFNCDKPEENQHNQNTRPPRAHFLSQEIAWEQQYQQQITQLTSKPQLNQFQPTTTTTEELIKPISQRNSRSSSSSSTNHNLNANNHFNFNQNNNNTNNHFNSTSSFPFFIDTTKKDQQQHMQEENRFMESSEFEVVKKSQHGIDSDLATFGKHTSNSIFPDSSQMRIQQANQEIRQKLKSISESKSPLKQQNHSQNNNNNNNPSSTYSNTSLQESTLSSIPLANHHNQLSILPKQYSQKFFIEQPLQPNNQNQTEEFMQSSPFSSPTCQIYQQTTTNLLATAAKLNAQSQQQILQQQQQQLEEQGVFEKQQQQQIKRLTLTSPESSSLLSFLQSPPAAQLESSAATAAGTPTRNGMQQERTPKQILNIERSLSSNTRETTPVKMPPQKTPIKLPKRFASAGIVHSKLDHRNNNNSNNTSQLQPRLDIESSVSSKASQQLQMGSPTEQLLLLSSSLLSSNSNRMHNNLTQHTASGFSYKNFIQKLKQNADNKQNTSINSRNNSTTVVTATGTACTTTGHGTESAISIPSVSTTSMKLPQRRKSVAALGSTSTNARISKHIDEQLERRVISPLKNGRSTLIGMGAVDPVAQRTGLTVTPKPILTDTMYSFSKLLKDTAIANALIGKSPSANSSSTSLAYTPTSGIGINSKFAADYSSVNSNHYQNELISYSITPPAVQQELISRMISTGKIHNNNPNTSLERTQSSYSRTPRSKSTYSGSSVMQTAFNRDRIARNSEGGETSTFNLQTFN